MTGQLLLGIDVGTSATKLVLVDPAGSVVCAVTRPAGFRSPHPGWAEADAEGWWANVQSGIPDLLRGSGHTAGQIVAVGVSGMVPALVLLDAEGRVLRPSIQQNDARAVAEIVEIEGATDPEEVLRRTGSPVSSQSIAPKLLWLRRHEPEIMTVARELCGSYDLVVRRLTGERSIERNWALESGLYDLQLGDWDEGMLRLATIDRGWLGPVHRPADVVGAVTPQAAAATTLRPGTPVVAGSADHVASAFSAGVIVPGDLLVKLGGAGDILYCSDRPLTDPRLFLDFHLADDLFLPNGCMAASGSLLVWFRDEFATGLTFADLDAEAQRTPAGSGGLLVLPYFLGEKTPLFDPQARGTFIGLTLAHTRGHVFRALLEGISLGFRHHLDVLQALGPLPATARCTNGGADSLLWKQITADVLGLPLEQVVDHPGSSLGAAFAAGMGIGAFRDWREIDRFVHVAAVIEPDPANHARYEGLYTLYRESYERLRDIFPRLRASAQQA